LLCGFKNMRLNYAETWQLNRLQKAGFTEDHTKKQKKQGQQSHFPFLPSQQKGENMTLSVISVSRAKRVVKHGKHCGGAVVQRRGLARLVGWAAKGSSGQ
jgi:hypothetical protein